MFFLWKINKKCRQLNFDFPSGWKEMKGLEFSKAQNGFSYDKLGAFNLVQNKIVNNKSCYIRFEEQYVTERFTVII